MSNAAHPPSLLTEWARLLLGSFQRAGVRDVVLSPGSRSTPFAWAALRDPGLRCHTILDERSAAFFAIGHARMTGEPALLICTSGSAAANYFPALVEAAESSVPVLVLTADRPFELQAAAAPQTIDQVKLYGDYARAYFELGTPDPDAGMLRALPRIAAQATLTSLAPTPGPVHLNARARKPLEPRPASGPDGDALRVEVDRLLERVPVAEPPEVRASAATVSTLARRCGRARRGLIVCGPATPRGAVRPDVMAALADATGFPVVAEAASQLRFADLEPSTVLGAFASLLEVPGFPEQHAPDLVIQVGRPPTASAWNAAMEAWTGAERFVLSAHGWSDPWSTAAGILPGPPDATVRAVVGALRDGLDDDAGPGEADRLSARREWREALWQANERASAVIDNALAGPFSEGAAVRAVVDQLPRNAILAVGNSLPIREVDTFAPVADRGLRVWFQRGANGIDGLISGAAGAAAAAGRPTTLLVGDVSFVHDIGGLRAVREVAVPLTIVVLNNGGGRIFERLPLIESLGEDPALDAWLTPPGVDFQAAAAAFGLSYARADDVTAVTAGLRSLADSGGVLEVVIPEGGTTEHQRELRRRLAAALG